MMSNRIPEFISLLLHMLGTLATGPGYGPMLGDIMVTVAGPCYDVYSNTSKIVCKFNDVETPAAVIDGTRAQCLLAMLLKLGQIPVALSVDGGLNYNHTGIFRLGNVIFSTILEKTQFTPRLPYCRGRRDHTFTYPLPHDTPCMVL